MSVWFRTTYFTSKTRVSGGFTPFRCRTWPIVKISIGCIKCTSLCLQNHFLFCHNEHANPLFQSKTHVLGGSMPFRSRNWHIAKTSIEAHLMHKFVPLEPFLVFLQQTCPIHYFRFCRNEHAKKTRNGSRGINSCIKCPSIQVFATCQVRLRNGMEPPKTWVLDWNSGLGMFVATKQEMVLEA